ncbi:MAG: serine/threonine protein kinase [Nitrososphaerales archaeon]
MCYPSSDKEEAARRVEELERLRVAQVIFEGRTKLGSLSLLGKGCVSLVVKAEAAGWMYALKIRRTDANRPSMRREADLQRFANDVGVGPKLHSVSDNFLLMDLVEGESIVSWIRGLKGPGSTARLRDVSREVLNQSFKLDQAGLDHGELSNLEKHVYVGRKVVMIDFETASLNRRVSNVTSAVQNIFIGGPQARKVRRMLRLKEIQPIIKSVRRYKEERSIKRFKDMLHELSLL